MTLLDCCLFVHLFRLVSHFLARVFVFLLTISSEIAVEESLQRVGGHLLVLTLFLPDDDRLPPVATVVVVHFGRISERPRRDET